MRKPHTLAIAFLSPIRWVCLPLYLLFSFALHGQTAYQPEISDPILESWRWHAMDVPSEMGVRSMTEDNEGNMWFGLDRGVMRYDGFNWQVYDEEPFLHYPVGHIYFSAKGQLFAGSESGLLRFNRNNWEKIFPESDSLHIPVTDIASLDSDRLLVGMQDGLLLLQENHIVIFTVHSRLNALREAYPQASTVVLPDEILFQRNFGRVDDIYVDADEQIWLFMSRNNDGKLLTFSLADTLNGVLQRFDLTSRLGGYPLSNRCRLLQTKKGERWLINGFYKSGILKQSDNKWEQIKLSDHFGGDELHTSIMEVSDGSLWVGGLGKLFVLKDQRWNVFSAPALPIPSSRIILHESARGHIWIAGIQGKVFRLNYGTEQWISYKGLNFQVQDQHGISWFIASDGKVVYRDENGWFAYDAGHGLIDAPVRLVSTREGRIWVAGSHQGVAATAYLSEGRWMHQDHPGLSWGIDPRSVFQDKDGALWFGASVDRQEALGQISGVLQLFNPDADELEWKHHTQQEGIGQHNVYGIGQSPDGAMWLGGTNLLQMTNQRWRPLASHEYLNEFVDIVYSRENLWVGSRYYGLFRFDGQTWTHYTKANGLPGNTIISVFEESSDRVWVVTDNDIAVFDGRKWYSGIFPEAFRIPREGGELIVDQDGAVWINKSLREWKRRAFPFSVTPEEAMQDFWTVRYKRGNAPPKAQIHLYSERISQPGNTIIGWSGNDYWEETPSSQLTFSYRLNQEDWSPFSKESSIVLTNLKRGRHKFEVKARDKDFNVQQIPASISFTVNPPIWMQTWFIILVLSFLFVIGFYETRLIRRNQKLSRLNISLQEANQTLENRQEKIQRQKEKIQLQKDELEKKAIILEEKNSEISQQRDQLVEMVEKVENLSKVKQRFFTNISHEFRTPLTLILGTIENLLASPAPAGKQELNRTYETIRRSSRRILQLINQILEVRRIETGQLELSQSRGDIIAFTKEIVNLFNDLADKQSVELHFSAASDSLHVMFDHDKLEKVLFNLLSNAFKNTPSGGKIEVMLYHEPADGRADKPDAVKRLVFLVRDTGKGIPAEFLPHIFDRFYQVDQSHHSKFDSSGIGLSYVKDLIAVHNGSISVKSQTGAGASFRFEIPLVVPGPLPVTDTATEQYEPEKLISDNIRSEIEHMNRSLEHVGSLLEKRMSFPSNEMEEKIMILIVEDEHELRRFIRQLLEPEFIVVEAIHGADGYDQAVAFQPDIIITDVMMPEMDGYELCHRLKNNLATNHIPVIMLTAKAAPENKLFGYKTGADAYIEKPFHADFLRVRIHNLLQSRQTVRDKVLRELVTQPGAIVTFSEDDKLLSKIKEVLEENVSDPEFDVESMSQHFPLSRCHFSRKVKQLTGLSPKGIIDSFRLKRAGQLLQQQKLSVSEVAYMVGFDHPNSFSRAFRKYFNMTPTEFASQN